MRYRSPLLGSTVLLVLAGSGGAWWYHTSRPEYLRECGEEAVRRRDFRQADLLAERLEAGGCPDHAHLLRGEIFLAGRRVAEAINELNQIRPDNEKIRFDAAVIFGQEFIVLNRPREAEQLLGYVISKQPDHVGAHRGLAVVYFDQGAKGLAVYHTRQWIRLAPEDGLAYRFLGIIYTDFGDMNPRAVEAFREALRCRLPPAVVDDVRLELAEVLVRQTEYAEALELLAALAPSKAQTQKALELHGACLHGLGRLAELRALVDQGLAAFPNSSDLLRLRGFVLLDADDPQAATVPLERAVQLDKHDHASRYVLAQAYESLGRIKEAAEQRRLSRQSTKYLDEMSALSTQAMTKPWDGPLRLRLAQICDELGLSTEATMWRKAAAACPPTPN